MDSRWFPSLLVLALAAVYFALAGWWSRRQMRLERARRRDALHASPPSLAAGPAPALPPVPAVPAVPSRQAAAALATAAARPAGEPGRSPAPVPARQPAKAKSDLPA